MEKYRDMPSDEYVIAGMKQSKASFRLNNEINLDDLQLSMLPYIFVSEQRKMLIVRIIVFFVDKDNKAVSNKFIYQMYFKFTKLPIIQQDNNIEISNIGVILSILDTTIGALRGTMYRWLAKSEYQAPLPIVSMDDLLKRIQVSFI